jgi:hypothetical protein
MKAWIGGQGKYGVCTVQYGGTYLVYGVQGDFAAGSYLSAEYKYTPAWPVAEEVDSDDLPRSRTLAWLARWVGNESVQLIRVMIPTLSYLRSALLVIRACST